MPAPPEEEGFAGWEQLSPRGSPEPDEGFADHEGFVEVAPTPPAWPGWDDDEHLLLSPASGRSSTSGDVIIVAGPGAAGLAGLEPSPARPLDFSPGLQPGADAPPTSAAMHTIFSPGLSGADGCREGSGVGPAGDSQDAVSQVPTGRLPDTSMALAPPAAAAPAAVPRPAEQGRLGAVAERPPASPQAPASAAAASASVVVAAAASSAPPPAASPAAAAAAAAAGQRHRSPLRSRPQQALQPNEDQQRHRPGAATKAPPAPPLPIVTSLAMADLIVIRPGSISRLAQHADKPGSLRFRPSTVVETCCGMLSGSGPLASCIVPGILALLALHHMLWGGNRAPALAAGGAIHRWGPHLATAGPRPSACYLSE